MHILGSSIVQTETYSLNLVICSDKIGLGTEEISHLLLMFSWLFVVYLSIGLCGFGLVGLVCWFLGFFSCSVCLMLLFKLEREAYQSLVFSLGCTVYRNW